MQHQYRVVVNTSTGMKFRLVSSLAFVFAFVTMVVTFRIMWISRVEQQSPKVIGMDEEDLERESPSTSG